MVKINEIEEEELYEINMEKYEHIIPHKVFESILKCQEHLILALKYALEAGDIETVEALLHLLPKWVRGEAAQTLLNLINNVLKEKK